MSDREITKSFLMDKMASDSDSDPDRAPSPDSQCVICLGRLQSKSFSDSCLHKFCFQCLVRWSKIKPECPLCKQPFKSIIHNVRSSVDYDQYHVQREEPSLEPTLRLSDIMSYRVMFFSTEMQWRNFPVEEQLDSSRLGGRPRALRMRASNHLISPPRIRDRRHYRHFRASIYRQNRWVNGLNAIGGPFRESSPQYYRDNPYQVARLKPWVQREISVLVPGDRAITLSNQILSSLTRIHINSRDFRTMLEPALGDRVDHFIHELKMFACSFYDMAGFDENAEYWMETSPLRSLRRARPPTRQSSFHSPPVGTNDSDVEIVEIIPSTTARPTSPIVISDSDSDVECMLNDLSAQQTPHEVDLLSSDEEPISLSTPTTITINENNDTSLPQTSRHRVRRGTEATSSIRLLTDGSRQKSKHQSVGVTDVESIPGPSSSTNNLRGSKIRKKRCVVQDSSSDSDSDYEQYKKKRAKKKKSNRAERRSNVVEEVSQKSRKSKRSREGDRSRYAKKSSSVARSSFESSDHRSHGGLLQGESNVSTSTKRSECSSRLGVVSSSQSTSIVENPVYVSRISNSTSRTNPLDNCHPKNAYPETCSLRLVKKEEPPEEGLQDARNCDGEVNAETLRKRSNSRSSGSSSDDYETLADVARRSYTETRVRSCVVVPPLKTVTFTIDTSNQK